MLGSTDLEQLDWATTHGRVLYSCIIWLALVALLSEVRLRGLFSLSKLKLQGFYLV